MGITEMTLHSSQDLWFILLNFYILFILKINAMLFRYPYWLNPVFFVSVGSMLFVSIPYFLDPVMKYEKEFQDFSIVAIYTIVGLTGFFLGYMSIVNPKNRKDTNYYKEESNRESIRFIPIIVFFSIGFLLQVIIAEILGISIFDKIINIRAFGGETFNIWETFWRFPYTFSYGLMNSAALFGIFALINNKLNRKHMWQTMLIYAIYILGLLVNFGTGTRMAVFAYLSFPIISYLYKSKYALSNIINALLIACLMLFVIIFLSNYRDVGLKEANPMELEWTYLFTYGLNQIIDFKRAIDIFSEEGILYGKTFLALLVNPIPREFWPDKPVGIGAIMGEIDPFTRVGVSVSITIYAESYANFGALGVFFVPFFFGLTMRKLYNYFISNRNTYRTALYFYVLSFIVNEVRGGFLEVTMRYMIELAFLTLLMKLSISKNK